MPRMFCSFDALSFDITKFKKSHQKVLETQMRLAAAAFLRAAIPRVPRDTGMAVGSYLNIGRFLRVAVPKGRGPYAGQRVYTHHTGAKYPKTAASGAELSTRPEDAFKTEGLKFIFEFKTSVYHYLLNDFGFAHGPWQSFEVGRDAAVEYLLRVLPTKLPQINDYLVKTTVSTGRDNVPSNVRITPSRTRGRT